MSSLARPSRSIATCFELVEPGFRVAVLAQLQRAFEGGSDRIKGAVDEERRALKHQRPAAVVLDAFAQRTGHPALADSGFSRAAGPPSHAGLLHLPPVVEQRRDFRVASDDRRQLALGCRLEAAFGPADAEHAIDPGGPADALQLFLAEVFIFKAAARHPAHALADDDGAGLGNGLQARGKIDGLAYRVPFAGGDRRPCPR